MHTEFSTARISKDKNYDGKFYFAVKTTGIFCRPSCPAPIAKEENVQYFDSLFETIAHGFRPCLRCRPDVQVEYYTTNISGNALVQTALQHIYDGYLNYHSIQELAASLHISDRHLRTVFVDSLGVPPVKIARYHKTLFAKKLLLSSDKSITDIAFASGFGSIRQCNDAFKDIFEKTPSAIRKEQQRCDTAHNNTTLLLRYDKPFHFQRMLDFLRHRAIPGVERITLDTYSRTFRTNNTEGIFHVRDNPAQSSLELRIVSDDIKCFMEIHNRVRRMFDLDTNFAPINTLFADDPFLAKGMIEGHVPRMPTALTPFEALIRAILGQQITVKAATTMAGRIVTAVGHATNDGSPDGLDFFFPTPEELLNANLASIGLTTTRQTTLHTATKAVAEKVLNLTTNQPFASFYRDCTALKGIGDWTAQYVAMRGLAMRDSFPSSDLGVIKALTVNGNKPSLKEILRMAEKWRPYRAYAVLCLWNSLAKDT